MRTTFAELEAEAMRALKADTQGRRIHAIMQAALNYAMQSELAKGHTLKETEIIDGIANGMNSILAMIAVNMSPDMALHCMRATNEYFTTDHAQYVAALSNTGRTATLSH